MIDEASISRSELRKRLPTLEKMYDFCVDDLGYYMPRFDSWTRKAKCITEDYLWGVIIGQYWSLKISDLRYPKKLKQTIPKRDLVAILQNEFNIQNLGFDSDHYPDKKWVITIIFTLNPFQRIFMTPGEVIQSNSKRVMLFNFYFYF